MEKVKKLTVPQVCILGIAAIWAFITFLALIFCIYANRRSRIETEESGRLARGHWREEDTAIQVRRVSEPFIRRSPPNLGAHNKAGKGVKHPARVYHSDTQRGHVAAPISTRNNGRAGRAGGDKKVGQARAKEGARRLHEDKKGEERAVLPKKELKRIPRR